MNLDEIAQELVRQRVSLGEINDVLIRQALLHYCNVSRVSIIHGISRPTLQKRMREWGWTLEKLHEWKKQRRLNFGKVARKL